MCAVSTMPIPARTASAMKATCARVCVKRLVPRPMRGTSVSPMRSVRPAMGPVSDHGASRRDDGAVSDTVAVIGSGAAGLAVALQLRRRGVNDVVVIDCNPGPGMGSTSRANGGVRAQFSTPVNIAFSRDTIAALRELDAVDHRVGYRAIGYLFLSGTDAGAAALLRSAELQRCLGVDVRTLTPRQVSALA